MRALAERIGEALPAVESATEAHFEAGTVTPEARKSFSKPALLQAEERKGLCRIDTGPKRDHLGSERIRVQRTPAHLTTTTWPATEPR